MNDNFTSAILLVNNLNLNFSFYNINSIFESFQSRGIIANKRGFFLVFIK